MLGKRTSEVILSYEEARNAQEFFRCVKRAKLLQVEMQSLKRRMEEIAAGSCIAIEMDLYEDTRSDCASVNEEEK